MDRTSFQDALQMASKLLKKGFHQVEKGRNNWVFEDKNRILTIPRHNRVKTYAIRVAGMQKLKSEGIPTAEILEYCEEKNGRPEYLIVQKIEGSNIDLSKFSSLQREIAHFSAGETLKKINSIFIGGYGRLDKNLNGQSNSWESFANGFFEESLKRVQSNPELWRIYSHKLIAEYEKNRSLLGKLSKPCFLHGDYHIGNLLFKNGEVVSVIDLDIITSGDPEWDTGHYVHTFNIDREKGVSSFRKGYGDVVNNEKERLYCLMIWTRKIGSQIVQRPEALKETIPELERILKGRI